MTDKKFDDYITKYSITVRIEYDQKYLVLSKEPALQIDKDFLYTHKAAFMAYIRKKALR